MRPIFLFTALCLVVASGCSAGANPPPGDCSLVVSNAKLILQKYDKDHDGKLSSAEWMSIGQQLDVMAHQTNLDTGSQGGENNIVEIQSRDRNHDGFIDLKELAIAPTEDPSKWKSCL